MEQYTLEIPEEHFTIVQGESNNQFISIIINDSLEDFEPKVVFPWHLSILFLLPERESGYPTKEEKDLLEKYEDYLIDGLKNSTDKPNALFISSRTGNDMKCVKFQVHDPEIANDFLQSVCEQNDTPFPMDYKMHHDPDWDDANGFFELLKTSL